MQAIRNLQGTASQEFIGVYALRSTSGPALISDVVQQTINRAFPFNFNSAAYCDVQLPQLQGLDAEGAGQQNKFWTLKGH